MNRELRRNPMFKKEISDMEAIKSKANELLDDMEECRWYNEKCQPWNCAKCLTHRAEKTGCTPAEMYLYSLTRDEPIEPEVEIIKDEVQ